MVAKKSLFLNLREARTKQEVIAQMQKGYAGADEINAMTTAVVKVP